MNATDDHISICVCTFKRAELLQNLLGELTRQETGELFSFSIVVADNDESQSARQTVLEFASSSRIAVTYCNEPRQNIALARNRAVANAKGNYIAFIDDDEFPAPNWLLDLYRSCQAAGADGVLGPVLPRFERQPPEWVIKGGLFDRPTHPTGFRIGLSDMRTGNVLFKTGILNESKEPFRAEFGTGGEDVDFFVRLTAQGCVFVWCNEAAVYETVPMARCNRIYLLKRAVRRGHISYRLSDGRPRRLAKALIALTFYGLSLPVLLIAGHHHFMNYHVKFCYHAGLLLAALRIRPFAGYQ